MLWIVQFLKSRLQNERFKTSINIVPTLLICLQLIGPLRAGMSFRTYCFLFYNSFFKVPGKYLKKILYSFLVRVCVCMCERERSSVGVGRRERLGQVGPQINIHI